jgi:SAM-dependent methyltransferase
MVAKLFAGLAPSVESAVLDPGCGGGAFISGILRACQANGWVIPRIIGVEQDPARAAATRAEFRGVPQVEIREGDFLQPVSDRYDFIVGNPPYVSILGLNLTERADYRARYQTAAGRFDLYALFFEQALRLLAPGGRLVFITPEKFLYVETARPLRHLLRQRGVEELHFTGEDTFAGRVTYPLITTVCNRPGTMPTRIIRRDGRSTRVQLGSDDSWLPAIQGFVANGVSDLLTLGDVCLRVSAGVATGADGIFVHPTGTLPPSLRHFAHPTISGRQITPQGEMVLTSSLLAPYDPQGRLLAEHRLGALGAFLSDPGRRRRLEGRTCAERKPWYSFHDNLPLLEMLRPKLLCKDITEAPFFVVDEAGDLVPRHTVYYAVPADPADLERLAAYLNSEPAREWLRAHCQRAANGYLRMQSHVLKRLPVPGDLVGRRAARRLQAELLPA